MTAAAASVLAGLAVALRPVRRVEVEGPSMVPALAPGDRLLVVRTGRRHRNRIGVGDVVVVPDPRQPDRLLVKRVAGATADHVTLEGDNAAASTDSRTFGPAARTQIWGRAVFRYHPKPVGTLRNR